MELINCINWGLFMNRGIIGWICIKIDMLGMIFFYDI